MTSLERLLTDALQSGAETTTPAPDLFERVMGSIEDDVVRRRRRRRTAAVWAGLVGALASAMWGLSTHTTGRWTMSWWVLELITSVALIGVALWLGPFIKRFGRAYAADVFRTNPRTGKSYIVLTDIVYYLIFSAYILFTIRLEPEPQWFGVVRAEQVQLVVYRLAGILLIIGVLHGINIVLMPVLGRLFSLNRRLDARNEEDGLDG